MENDPPSRAPRRANDLGPAGHQAARNLEALREARHLSQKELADRMTIIGRPMTMQMVSKIEQGARRVDVDDLVTFAAVLGVAPSALLLPRDVDVSDLDAKIQLTENIRVRAAAAWLWMDGQEPLPQETPEPVPDARGRLPVYATPADRLADFLRHSRPGGSYGDRHPAAAAVYNLSRRLNVLLQDLGNPATWDLYKNFLNIWYERLGLELRALLAENEAAARQADSRSRAPFSAPPSGSAAIDEELKLAEMVKRSGGEWVVRDREGTVRPVVEQDGTTSGEGADGGPS